MISLKMNDEVKTRLAESLKAEDDDDACVRIREYSTGTPCCRKTVLGFTIDEPDDDDVRAEIEGLPFIMNEDLVEKWQGGTYQADMDEHGNPRIVAQG